jgi:transposase
MDTNFAWAGLDLGEELTTLCVVDDQGEVLLERSCRSVLPEIDVSLRPFASRLQLVAAEAGTGTHLLRKLSSAGYPVAIFEARKAKKFLTIRQNKSDESDARGLADLARLGRNTVSRVHMKSVDLEHLRSELVMRHKLVRLRVVVEGSLRSRLAMYGRRMKPIRSAIGDDGIDLREQLEPLMEVAEGLRKYLRCLDKQFERRANDNDVCKRLMEVPGVGPICALSFYSAIEDPNRFTRVSDVGAYLGLVPKRYQSGRLSRTAGITKSGNKLTRTLLVTSAQSMRRHNVQCALAEWGEALRERLGSGRAKVAVARKLAIVLLKMWKTGAHFEPYPN